MINSSLVSAQNRQRLYWTNIGMESKGLFGDLESIIEQPKDKGILLKDILESEVDDKYYLSDRMTKNMTFKNESLNIIGHSGTGGQKGVIHNNNGKCSSLCATDYTQPKQIICHNMMLRSGDPKKGGTGHLERQDGKTYCLDTGSTNAVEYNKSIRRLTPIECERLQTVKDNYTNHVSDTQRYKMLGNGWTVNVIAHIFSYLK